MKLTIQKILICALSLIFSIAACVCGMYMTLLANMVIWYRILFCLFFILNPVLTIFMIRFMFKKPVPKEETEGEVDSEKKKKWGFSKKDEPVPAETETVQAEEPETTVMSYSDSANEGSTYNDTGYTVPVDTENSDVTASASELPELQSFGGELDDDLDSAGSVSEKTAGPVTEDSVAKFKKISLKRKKRADE